MWLLLQIVGFLSAVAAFSASLTVVFSYVLQVLKPAFLESMDWKKCHRKPAADETHRNEPYILRKKDYDTYRSIKYVTGVKSASLVGSTLILIDLDLIKTINQKDFAYFSDRHPPSFHSDPTMNKMLSFATGDEWKALKTILTQAFSTSRIRQIQYGLHESAFKLLEYMKGQLTSAEGGQLDIVAPANKYLLELIACSVFGLEETGIFTCGSAGSNSAGPNSAGGNPSGDSDFEVYTKEVQKAMIRHRQARLIPGGLRIGKLFNFFGLDPKALQFFKTIIDKSILTRKQTDSKSDDLLQLLMDARSQDTDTRDVTQRSSKVQNRKLTDEMILSQALMFFFAGTEGPATLLIYGLYELAMNPQVQEKLYDEIANGMEVDNSLDYDTLMNLPYLDMFVCEVLRMYSSGVTARRCGTQYQVPGTEIIVEPGTNVHTPIYGIHHDEEFYPEPFKFNPERFSPEAKATRPPGSYMPFGIGPRSCIAQKFGLVQGKSALGHLVYNFKVEPCWRTETPPKGSLETMFLPNNLWLKFKNRLNK